MNRAEVCDGRPELVALEEKISQHIAQQENHFQEINALNNVSGELYMGRKYGDLPEMVSSLRSLGQDSLKKDLNLKAKPDLLLFGTILERETIVAPMRGIIMQVAYRLEFYDPSNRASTIVEVKVKEHFKDCTKVIVSEIIRQAALAGAK